jgi:transcription-repair coupling factor (superfamily II helicase)
MEKEGVTLKLNQIIEPNELAKKLFSLDYENVGTSTPTKAGEFAKRGNLVDIWLERYKLPVRIDLIGETIENIYLFNYITQKKERNLKEVYIVPFGVTPKLASKWSKRARFPAQGGKVERLFLSEIEPGDLVVHIDYGIGRFLGLGGTEVGRQQFDSVSNPQHDGSLSKDHSASALAPATSPKLGRLAVPNQFLVVEYAKGDKLYVPVEQIDRLTKYIGAPGFKPRLNNLGTSGWEKIRAKVQESIVLVARDLLNLYAQREIVKKIPYLPDTSWQKQLEDSFEFEETADQIKTTKEIKSDLESNKPMDRILVGDVGFGKTEVAVRAAFKVVQEGKQVALLAPTTILVEQHYQLFSKRLNNFPVAVEMLSRFREEAAQEKIVEKLRSGTIDIIIGTHRLLSPDVQFKNLGLIIIDEEHRFGVKHKEKLKNLEVDTDVLSMSATPIPRSLHMALTALRDVSVLEEPPAGRVPINTYVGEYNEEKIKEALNKEVTRGGQAYYVFNNVQKIAEKALEVAALVPDSHVVFAHGQMREAELERAMEDFYSGKADILVCTTIIGSGLDMPNVNTIVIENAQRFGLAELHQLRGRVGRSARQAYALLFYPKGYVTSGDVLERLTILAERSELGAGFKIAKRDLEIRGAGNLLGVAQSGNIALVGFELYIQLLSQTIDKIKLTVQRK